MSCHASRFVADCLLALSALAAIPSFGFGFNHATVVLTASSNPSYGGQAVTLTATVSGDAGTPTGTVEIVGLGTGFINRLCGPSFLPLVAGSASCTTTSLVVGTQTLMATYSGDDNYAILATGYLTQLVNAVPPASANVALASNGGVATASSVLGGFPVSRVNDGDRTGAGDAFWADATPGSFPDSVEIAFSGVKSIDRVFVYSVQDDAANPVDPSDVLAFTLGGLTDFTVEGWDGNAWVNLGTVIGNDLVKRTVNFSPFSTDRIRVSVTRALGPGSRIAEIEAFAAGAAPAPATPRMRLTAKRNPIIAGQAATFTGYVAGNGSKVTGTMTFRDGTEPVAGCVALPLAPMGAPDEVGAACTTSSLSVGTHPVTADYSGNPAYARVISSVLNQVVDEAPPPAGSNVALAGNGGVAYATSTLGGYAVASVNDGDRTGAGGNFWVDGTPGTFPDFVVIAFGGPRTIDRVTVYSVQDAYANPAEPGDATSFSLYGVQGFTVHGWNGTDWVTLATVTNNSLVKRTVTFPPFTAGGILVSVTGAADAHARLVEIEAFSTGTLLAAPAMALVSQVNPTITGQMVAFISVLAGSMGLPTGTVTFLDGGTPIAGCSSATPYHTLDVRYDLCITSGLSAGTHSITAAYAGDSYYAGTTSAAVAQVVNAAVPIESIVTVNSTGNPSYFGQRGFLIASISNSTVNFPTGTMAFLDGGVPVPGCEAVPLSLVASCDLSTLAVGTHSIVASYSGNGNYTPGVSSPYTQVVNAVPAGGINVALASNGGLTYASSTLSGYNASNVNNGDRTGAGLAFWADATPNAFPDGVGISFFTGTKTIDRVVVYSVQDDYANPVEPGDTTTFSSFGLTDFFVQGWDGSNWVTLGTVTGNNLVKRTVSFPAFATGSIRVIVTGALNAYSRIVEIEAWGN